MIVNLLLLTNCLGPRACWTCRHLVIRICKYR